MHEAEHRRGARRFIAVSSAKEGGQIGTWAGFVVGAVVGRDFLGMAAGSFVGMTIGWIVGRYNARLL